MLASSRFILSLAQKRSFSSVEFVDVTLRDGLQTYPHLTDKRLLRAALKLFSTLPFPLIELGAYVSPKICPNMAFTPSLVRKLPESLARRTYVLIPNYKAWQRFCKDGGSDKGIGVALLGSSSDAFLQNNLNISQNQFIDEFIKIATEAKTAKVPIYTFLSNSLGNCPLEKMVASPVRVAEQTDTFFQLGAARVFLCDTNGNATPKEVVEKVYHLKEIFEIIPEFLDFHLHGNTQHILKLMNAALKMGVHRFHGAFIGLGGCPKSGSGPLANASHEQIISRFPYEQTGFDLNALFATSKTFQHHLNRIIQSE